MLASLPNNRPWPVSRSCCHSQHLPGSHAIPAPTLVRAKQNVTGAASQLSASASAQQAAEKTKRTTVLDYLMLLQVRPDVDEERAQEMLDKIWSLQYMIPAGALCAFAGRLLPGQSGQAGGLSAFTHAAHFRFSGEKQLQNFRQHAKFEEIFTAEAQEWCNSITEASIGSRVPQELELIFRRGSQFETGADMILLLEGKEGIGRDDMATFCSSLCQMADMPQLGAVQSSHGEAHVLSGNLAGTHLVFSRFELAEQVTAFMKSPPCIALQQGDDRLPATAVGAAMLDLAPTERKQTRQAGAGGILGVSNR